MQIDLYTDQRPSYSESHLYSFTNERERLMANTYGYIRVSTKVQAADGLSIDSQQRQIEGYAMMKGLSLDHIFIERAVSGSKPFDTRPEGKRLTAILRAGDSIICSKLDRMFRNAKDALSVSDDLRERNVNLHLLDLGGDVTNNGVSKMFFTIVAAFAEFERDRTAERISDIKSNEKEKGRFLGGSKPFGFQVSGDGELIPDNAEQNAIHKIKQLRREGKSLRVIAEAVTSPTIKISHVMVKRIIEQEIHR